MGRHVFLAEHFARFFSGLGLETKPVVGMANASVDSQGFDPDIVIGDYELLATLSLQAWKLDDILSRRPVIAVGLSKRPNEVQDLDVNGIDEFSTCGFSTRMLRCVTSPLPQHHHATSTFPRLQRHPQSPHSRVERGFRARHRALN